MARWERSTKRNLIRSRPTGRSWLHQLSYHKWDHQNGKYLYCVCSSTTWLSGLLAPFLDQGCNYGFRVCRKFIMLEILRKTFCMARVCFTGFNAWSYDMTWDSWEAGFTRSAFAGEFTRQRTPQQTNNGKRSNRLLAFDYLKFIKIVLCKKAKAKAKEKIILSNLF